MITARKRLAIIALAAVALALAGCGDTSKSSTASSGVNREPGAATPAPAEGGAGTGADSAQSGAGTAKTAPTTAPIDPAALQRSIVYTGSLDVRVDDVNAAAAQAEGIATGAGGYVGGDNRVIQSTRSTAVLTLRVPAAGFTATMTALSDLGHETRRQVSTQDVTAQVIDVASRVKTQQASVDRIRALLARATSISEIESVESELTRREADLESLQAQQRQLSDLTSLSTITATFLGPEAIAKATTHHDTGFLAGLKSGWHTFLASVSVLLTVIGALLPFAVVVGIPLLVWWRLARRRRQGKPAAALAPSAADSASTSAANPGSSA